MALAAGCSGSVDDSTDTASALAPRDVRQSLPRAELSEAARSRLQRLRASFPAALAASGAAAPLLSAHGNAVFSSPRARVELPSSAADAVVLTDVASGMRVSFTLDGASDVALGLDGDLATYPGAGPGAADVIHRQRPNGTEDFVAFDRRPAAESLAYSLDVSAVAGLRLVENTLELLDAKGSPRLRVAPPYVIDARGGQHPASLHVEGCAFQTDPRAPWGRPVTAPGASTCTVVVRWDGAHVTYPALVDPTWETAGDMVQARTQAVATEIDPASPGSVVLFTGGFNGAGTALTSAELYFPGERTFAKTSDLQAKRGAHTATRLTGGNILVAGGLPTTASDPEPSMELYNPQSGTFSTVAIAMNPARAQHTATLLADGSVLFAGGTTLLGQPTITAVRLDPAATGFTALGPMTSARAAHTATPLRNGKVLIVGGFVQSQNALLSVELFDPAANAFENVTTLGAGLKTQMTKARAFHTATRVDCKTVLITGGTNKLTGGIVEATAELWQDDENTTSDAECPTVAAATVRGLSSQVLTMTAARARHTATLLPTGQVVVVAGTSGAVDLTSTELFEPAPALDFIPYIDLGAGHGRRDHAAVLVKAGPADEAGRGVLVAGGVQGGAPLATAFVLAKNLGETCAIDQDCESGFCTDGVCCNVRCDALCLSCAATQKQDPDPLLNGVCGPEKKIDPADVTQGGPLLPGELPSECNGEVEVHKFCDGDGNVLVQDFPCEPATCGGDGFCTSFCNCNEPGCSAGDSKCAKFGWCDVPAQQCADKFVNGGPCQQGYQCVSGFCVDGLCCQTACDNNQCEACDVAGKPGICSAVGTTGPEQPHPNTGGTFQRDACAGEGTCVGFCSGLTQVDKCTFPGSDVVAQPPTCGCADGDADCATGPVFITKYLCDGAGKVAEDTATQCGGTGLIRCDGEPGQVETCLAKCTADGDCLEDAYCDAEGACQALPEAGRCNAELTELRQPGGADKACAPYRCGSGTPDACRSECTQKDDCLGGTVCNTAGQCVDGATPAPEAPSCSASPASARGRDSGLALLLAFGALAFAGARRRRG